VPGLFRASAARSRAGRELNQGRQPGKGLLFSWGRLVAGRLLLRIDHSTMILTRSPPFTSSSGSSPFKTRKRSTG
jgi:hypothetical protein